MKSYSELNEDEKYLVDERQAIKIDSGIPEMEAKRQAMREFNEGNDNAKK